MLTLRVLSEFSCCQEGHPLPLSPAQQRLISAIAVHEVPVTRDRLASQLFPDTLVWRARARLRQLVFRSQTLAGANLFDIQRTTIGLACDVTVDYHAARQLLRGLRRADSVLCPPPAQWNLLCQPLLPDTDLNCLEPARTQWDVDRARVLEAMANACLDQGLYSGATELADAAADINELREAPRRTAIDACLRQGEIAEAHLRFRCYEQLLQRELGVAPSNAIPELLKAAGVTAASGAGR